MAKCDPNVTPLNHCFEQPELMVLCDEFSKSLSENAAYLNYLIFHQSFVIF